MGISHEVSSNFFVNRLRANSATDSQKKQCASRNHCIHFCYCRDAYGIPRSKHTTGIEVAAVDIQRCSKEIGSYRSLSLNRSFVLLVFPLQQGGTQYPWHSATIMTTLILSAVLWVAFMTWQWWIDIHSKGRLEPIFPWRLARKRFYMGMLLYVICPSLFEIAWNERPIALILPGIHSFPASPSTL